MQIVDGRVKPCSNCLKARQKAKDLLDRATGKFKQYTLVECERGDITINNETHLISATSVADWQQFVGTHVYISGQWIMAVKPAKPIGAFGPIIKITKTD